MKTTIEAGTTDADVEDIRTARRLAEQIRNMHPDGMGYRVTLRRYKAIVDRLGYDPIS